MVKEFKKFGGWYLVEYNFKNSQKCLKFSSFTLSSDDKFVSIVGFDLQENRIEIYLSIDKLEEITISSKY